MSGDLMGSKEVCEALGVKSGNLRKVKGLPAPLQELASGPVWEAEGIRRLARQRQEERNGTADQ